MGRSSARLYIVLEKMLDAGLKMAQAVHAFKAFQVEHPEVEAQWFLDSNNIVVLHEDDVPSLADKLEELGFRVSRFFEPDRDGQLTGICAEPAAWKQLSNIPLAR